MGSRNPVLQNEALTTFNVSIVHQIKNRARVDLKRGKSASILY